MGSAKKRREQNGESSCGWNRRLKSLYNCCILAMLTCWQASEAGAQNLPGRIQAEDYRSGGEGVAYHDTTAGNSPGGQYRTDDVDIATCSEGGYYVTSTATGEWLTYDVNIATAGDYLITLRVASGATTNRQMHIYLDGSDVAGAIIFAPTGGAQNWTDVVTSEVALPSGQHVLKAYFNLGNTSLNYIDVELATAPNTAPSVTAGPSSQSIELTGAASLTGSASDDGLPTNTLSTLWTKVSGPGHHSVVFENAYELNTDVTFTLPGTYVLRLTADDGELQSSADVTVVVDDTDRISLPGRIEAEDYRIGGEGVGYHDTTAGNTPGGQYRTDDVDITICAEGGYNVNYTAAGEWLAYNVDIASTGFYDITARVGSAATTNRTIHITLDDVNITGSISFAPTGNSQIYTNVTAGVILSAGKHVLKVFIDTNHVSLNYIDVTAQTCSANIVTNGVANADIVRSGTPTRTVTIAAQELQTTIQQITGATLPIVTAPTGAAVHIYVGQSSYTDALGITNTGLTNGAFRIVSGTNWLVLLGKDDNFTPIEPYAHNSGDAARALADWDTLTGKTWALPFNTLYKEYDSGLNVWSADGRGSLNAVYEFLRNLGMRWYFPGSIGQITPQSATLGLPKVNRTIQPEFGFRDMYQLYQRFNMATDDEIKWQFRLGLDTAMGEFGFTRGHGILNVIERAEVKTAHPEYYALYGGVRQTATAKPCLSSTGLFDDNVDFVQTLFDHYGEPMVSVMPTDGYVTMCQCSLCSGKGTPERGTDGSMSDYVWDYVNRVAAAVYQTHPTKKISCCAYGSYILPPLDIQTMSPNLIVIIARARTWLEDPSVDQYYRDITDAWLEKLPSDRVYVWDYYLSANPANELHGIPVYYPELIAKDLRFLKGKSGGDFIEVYRNQTESSWHSLAANHLNMYVTSRMYWDVNQDVNAILDEYYEAFYGPAAEEMKAFVEYAEANWFYALSDSGIITQMWQLLGSAQTAAGSTGIYRDRVDMLEDFMNQ